MEKIEGSYSFFIKKFGYITKDGYFLNFGDKYYTVSNKMFLSSKEILCHDSLVITDPISNVGFFCIYKAKEYIQSNKKLK